MYSGRGADDTKIYTTRHGSRLLISSPHGQRHTCAQRRRPAHAGARSLWAKPVIRDNARPNKPTAFGGIAGRFAGRFVTSDQPRGIRAAASVPGRSGTAARAPIGRRAPIGPVLGARARGFRRTRRARIETQWPADGCEAAVSAAQQAGVNGRCAAGVVEANGWRVQNQAGKLRADAATGGGRGNSRLHLHPRRHSRRSGHALRAPGHHHWSALSSCASGESTRSGAWRHAESKATAVEIGASSMCCEASVLALGECPAPARPR
jgi:hypothetical protein